MTADKQRRNKLPHKRFALILSIALTLSISLILVLSVSGTLAYLVTKSAVVTNQFTPSYVTSEVNISDDTIDVTNTGNVDAYIRASIVVNWMDNQGNVRGIAPKASEYTLGINTTDWALKGDIYYYNSAVAPDSTTNDLITSIALNVTPPTGYELSVEVVAEAIQADGVQDVTGVAAVVDAWGVQP